MGNLFSKPRSACTEPVEVCCGVVYLPRHDHFAGLGVEVASLGVLDNEPVDIDAGGHDAPLVGLSVPEHGLVPGIGGFVEEGAHELAVYVVEPEDGARPGDGLSLG